jgi:hypothetical protein
MENKNMRYCILILMLLAAWPSLAQNAPLPIAVTKDKGVLIKNIEIEGFVLGDKSRFVRLFKPYRNKYLTPADMDALLSQIQIIYEREGYQQLVSITYKADRHRLVFTALMTS